MEDRRSNLQEAAGVCRECGRECTSVALVSCPDCGGPIGPHAVSAAEPIVGLLHLPAMRYPSAYVWFVFISVLDLLLTGMILTLEGVEVNPIADAVLQHGGPGMLVLFKFALVVFVVVNCEWIGRRNDRAGRKLAEWAVAITCIPVALSFYQLLT